MHSPTHFNVSTYNGLRYKDWHNTDHDERSAQRYTLSPGVANYFRVHQITDAAC